MRGMASRSTTTDWRLYLDESGKFGDDQAPVCVAGVMVRDDLPGSRPEQIRSALNAAAPGFPWPWHAAWLNNQAWVALSLVAAVEHGALARSIPAPAIAAAVEAEAFLREREPRLLDTLRAAMRAKGKSDFAALERCSRSLRASKPHCAAELDGYVRRAWAALRQVGGAYVVAGQQLGDPWAAAVVAAAETRVGDAIADSAETTDEIDGSRYLTLLAVTIERAGALLGRRPGRHRLYLHVLERHVIHPRFRGKVMLQIPIVNDVIRDLGGALPQNVSIVPAEVTAFDQQKGVRFVMADFVANRGRRWLDTLVKPLPSVERDIEGESGLPVRTGAPSRSHLAASGEGPSRVTGRSSPTGGRAAGRPPRRWAREQAAEWAEGR